MKVGESMFVGQFLHNLDSKNRIIVPAKFRPKLGDRAIITVGLDKSLAIYTEEEWLKLQTRLLSLNTNESNARKYIRFLVASATECNFDNNGRVILPNNLLEYGNIQKELVIIGNLNHIEIWSKENWDDYYTNASKEFEEVAERLEFGNGF